MMRIMLFLVTNIAIMVVLNIVLMMLGIDSRTTSGLLLMCAVFGFGGAFISLFISKWMAKMSTGAQLIEQPRNADERWLVETVSDLAQRAGIGMPEVAVFPSSDANAFATGWNRNNALVAVSAGLLQRFSRDEVRAVLGHEIGHVANGDMVTLTLIQGVLNTFVMFIARIIGGLVDRDEDGRRGIGYFVTVIAMEVVLGILASMIVAWFSRRREYRADHAGASLASPAAMISALEHLRRESGVPSQMPESMTAFGINNNHQRSFTHLFMSHPPLEERIAALRGIQA